MNPVLNKYESSPKQSLRPQYTLNEYETLLNQGNLASPFSLARKLEKIELNNDEQSRLTTAGRRILWHDNTGFGYVSSSSMHNGAQELKVVSYIARCFQERKTNPAQPVIVSIDDFYRFIPGRASLVAKTQIFDEIAQEQNPEQDFAIILTGFSDSEIFTREILESIPTQNKAGLDVSETTPFGRELLDFATNQLQLLMEETKGDLNATLHELTKAGGSPEEDAKLLLVTGLLLQDRQTWQKLWYEGRKKGTSLYIVAPMSFHDAMNRLNLGWGHGVTDYSYRASCSLGNEGEPPLEDGVKLKNYHDQGLSSQEFQRRVEPILNKFKK